MLQVIKQNKESANSYTKNEDTSQEDTMMLLEVTVDMTYITNMIDYKNYINEILSFLHD